MNLIELEWQHLKQDEIPGLLLELAYAVIDGVETRGQKGNYCKQHINFNNNSPISAD
jgi:putative transposase